MNNRGSYAICIRILERITVKVGSLGDLVFEPGRYIYVGSALKGIIPRISRHAEMSKGNLFSFFWHIDYLLKEKNVIIESFFIKISDDREECAIAEQISMISGSIANFGSSDCKCKSHLFKIENYSILESIGLKKFQI
jgi:Uri superfamily endonuclease